MIKMLHVLDISKKEEHLRWSVIDKTEDQLIQQDADNLMNKGTLEQERNEQFNTFIGGADSLCRVSILQSYFKRAT